MPRQRPNYGVIGSRRVAANSVPQGIVSRTDMQLFNIPADLVALTVYAWGAGGGGGQAGGWSYGAPGGGGGG